MASKNDLRRAPVYFRAAVAKGLEQVSSIQADGGRFGAGFIPGVAVLTRGEALGHGMWVDREFIAQVDAALKAEAQGVKSRYTHPDMSGDALAKGLGRVTWAQSSSPDVVRGDLHIWKSARTSPDGDLGAHILERATEDPASFGTSISFLHDFEASKAHFIEHGGRVIQGPYGEEWDASGFKSPDPDNKENLPHVRLAKLRAVDVVDDPAANPNGLFHRDETFQEAEALLAYAIGETKGPKPECVKLGVDPDRASGFLRRFLSTRGLSIVKVKDMGRFAEGETGAVAEVAKVETEAPVAVAEAVVDAEETETETEAEPSSNITTTKVVAELGAADPRAEVKRYLAAFGAQGGEWYAEGLTFEQCYQKRLEQLSADNAKLRKQLELSKQSEPSALSQGGADKGSKKGKGFSSKLRIQGVEQTPAE